MSNAELVPVLILGGHANALSIARSLGQKGIVVSISEEENCLAFKSKYCKKSYPVPTGQTAMDFWYDLLLINKCDELSGCAIMVGSDLAVEFMSAHKTALSKNYILDDFDPDIQLAMLNKQKTLELAEQCGCAIPAFWNINTIKDVEQVIGDVTYPVMIKPINSHLFQKQFIGKKYLLANSRSELLNHIKQVLDKNLQLMVTEMIQGADDMSSSYHTYINESGEHLFHYTHKINRRFPKNSGIGTLHTTTYDPNVAEMGRRFFNGINYRGMGHIEFKYDVRDKQLKVIECNPRFSAALAISTKSGLDMSYLIYCHMVGSPLAKNRTYRTNVKSWMVLQDIFALKQLLALGEISYLKWLKSLFGSGLVFPYFRLSDPMPFFAIIYRYSNSIFIKIKKRWIKRV